MKVEIWSDVVCPWCYIGKRRFEAALARFEHRDEVEVVWKSFELDPDAPAVREGTSAEHLARKYGMTPEQTAASQARLTGLAAEEGLSYRLEATRGGNTFDAHRLIHLAASEGRGDEMKERLMLAYFTEGVAVGDRDELVRLGEELGLTGVREGLESDAFADAVREDEREARQFGIGGVPFFVVDRYYGVEGAQSADYILATLNEAWAAKAAA
jgi:predicted DsbA family dithiol-disulfide isomerase